MEIEDRNCGMNERPHQVIRSSIGSPRKGTKVPLDGCFKGPRCSTDKHKGVASCAAGVDEGWENSGRRWGVIRGEIERRGQHEIRSSDGRII